jgi:glycosyltransferase involved in cell wall biosynthesis
MRILYASHRSYIPERLDGALYAAHSLLSLLVRRGHQCEAAVTLDTRYRARAQLYRALRLLTGRRRLALADRRTGYVTRRAWEGLVIPLVRQRIAAFRPDLVLTQLEGCEAIAAEAIAAGIPVVVWVHDNEFTYFKGRLGPNPLLLTVSATDFVAGGMAERLGCHSPVLYPPVDLDRCRAPRDPAADMVTLINPVREKGVQIALGVAALLPHRRFLLVETWPLSGTRGSELRSGLAGLPNVTLRPPSPTIGPVYGRTKVLLAPSQWVEAFCTVALEANANGIPVVASRIGGIPTTVGEGGVLLSPDSPPEAWAQAVERLLTDARAYEEASQKALLNAARPAFAPAAIVDRFLELAGAHVAAARSASPALAGRS